MDSFTFTTKKLAGTAFTKGPAQTEADTYSLGFWKSTATLAGDKFFDVKSAIASTDNSFATMMQKKEG